MLTAVFYIGVLAAIGFAAFYFTFKYMTGKSPFEKEPNLTEEAKALAPEEVKAVMFGVKWCPYCKTMKPLWQKIHDKYDGQIVNGKKVKVEHVDCEDEPSKAKLYKVYAYPTIKLIRKDQIMTYKFGPDLKKLETFIDETTKVPIEQK